MIYSYCLNLCSSGAGYLFLNLSVWIRWRGEVTYPIWWMWPLFCWKAKAIHYYFESKWIWFYGILQWDNNKSVISFEKETNLNFVWKVTELKNGKPYYQTTNVPQEFNIATGSNYGSWSLTIYLSFFHSNAFFRERSLKHSGVGGGGVVLRGSQFFKMDFGGVAIFQNGFLGRVAIFQMQNMAKRTQIT